MKTWDLGDRVIYEDGRVAVSYTKAMELLREGVSPKHITTERNTDLERSNKYFSEGIRFSDDVDVQHDLSWPLPEKYVDFDVLSFCNDKIMEIVPDEQFSLYTDRLAYEYAVIEDRGFLDFIRYTKYIIDLFDSHSIQRGVGRGSSSACLLLYLLGLHLVDPVKYDIPFKEFIKDA